MRYPSTGVPHFLFRYQNNLKNKNMQIYLLRHGNALEQDFDDISRPLSDRGKEEIKCAAKILVEQKARINSIFTSPLLRAQQTTAIVNQALMIKELVTTEYLVPGTDQRQIIDELNRKSLSGVLLVGHEPHLNSFISLLISGSRGVNITIGKGSLALIDSPAPIKPGSGILRWLISPEFMI